MKRLTAKKRKQIYLKSMESYFNSPEFGMCHHIKSASNKDSMGFFPEFKMVASNRYLKGAWWFMEFQGIIAPQKQQEIRLTLFALMIVITK